jgi:asparagine synthase (glutamine-hydrolysing)
LREPQDVIIARRVAELCRQPYQVIQIGDEFLASFPEYAERSMYLMEGRLDVNRSTDLFVSEKARQIAPVKVVGTYGSEIIRQAVMFKPSVPQPGLYSSDFLTHVSDAAQTYVDVRRGNPISFAVFRQSPWYMSQIFALEQTQLTVRCPYLDNDFVRTAFRMPQLDVISDIRLRLITEGNSALARIRTDRGVGGSSGWFFGLASRSLLEFTFKAEYAYDYGMPQWVAQIDHLLSPFRLERLFLGRHKLSHFRIWYRQALSKYVQEMLLDRRTLSRPYLERKGVESIVEGHLRGGRTFTKEIHKVLTLELLHRRFFDHN